MRVKLRRKTTNGGLTLQFFLGGLMKTFHEKRGESEAPSSPCCGQFLDRHRQFDLASVAVGTLDELVVERHVAARLWQEAHRYQAANAISDIKIWRVILCDDGRAGLVTVAMPIEMWADDQYGVPELIGSEMSAKLLNLAPLKNRARRVGARSENSTLSRTRRVKK